jgi:protocatechuate 3,4-dioxygenase beta subunit
MRALWNRAPLLLAAVFLAALLMPAVHAGETPAKGRVLAGKVVDEEGQPVAGAKVMLERNEPVVTRESGVFEILNPPTETHTLAVYQPGFAPLVVPRLEIAEKDLRVDLGTLTLRKAAVLEGRVADPEGKPVAGAKVIASILAAAVMDRFKGSIQENPGNLVTDAEGRFRLKEVHPREKFTVYVQRTGYIDETLQVTRVTAGQPLEIVLRPEAAISGRVIDEAGEPVANATVRFMPEARTAENEWRGAAATGPDGSFLLEKLDAGPARLVAAAEECGTAEIDLTLEAGEDRKNVVLRLRAEGPTLEGRVSDSQGRPVAGASVHVMLVMPLANRGSATTDENGRFRLDGLLLGEVTVYASHPENSRSIQRKVLLQPGRNEIDLAFPPGHPVSGRVVNDQGVPVADSSIRIESTDPLKVSCQCTTAADGSFITCELPDGNYQIHAWSGEQGGTPWLPVQVSGRPVTDLELQLQPRARIVGRIRGMEPDQILWLTVWALNVKTSEVREGRIAHDGRYEISNVLPGSWEIRLWDPRPPYPPPGQRKGTLLGPVTLEPGATEAQADFEVTGEVDGRGN